MAFETTCRTCEGENTLISLHTQRLDIEVLGLNVEVCPICIRIFTSEGTPLTPLQEIQVQEIITAYQNLLSALTPDIL